MSCVSLGMRTVRDEASNAREGHRLRHRAGYPEEPRSAAGGVEAHQGAEVVSAYFGPGRSTIDWEETESYRVIRGWWGGWMLLWWIEVYG